MPRQANDPREHVNLYIFTDSDLIYSHEDRWEGVQNIFTFLGKALKKITETHSYIQYMPYKLAQFSEQEPLTIHKTTEHL